MVVQSNNNITFELHSLGWKAFQDLCGTILKNILGQTFQVFGQTNDGGRDGSFRGVWEIKGGEQLEGAFTVQCKFTKNSNKNLSLSLLSDEITKAKKLAKLGLCKNYILITNYQVTGESDTEIREAFLKIDALEDFLLYGYEWINDQIVSSKELRMLVPRVYGLGDLSQILDSRAIDQAKEILSSMGEDLSKFVITDAYKRSTEALIKHGIVMLLGEAASGKSTIAASLAIASKDSWDCEVIKINNPSEFKQRWNPSDNKRFFWIDDAFGATQYQRDLSLEWNSVFPEMKAALKSGNKFAFTSRDYIFHSARRDLKSSEMILFNESKVLIQVENLSKQEKEQILYNHIELGNQTPAYKTQIKPFLEKIADNTQFKPEIARRFGSSMFTKKLLFNNYDIKQFIEHPIEFLMGVVSNLDKNSRSAISLLYMTGGELQSPINLTEEQRQVIETIGGSVSGVKQAFESMDGSLAKIVTKDGIRKWTFKHPTIGDAYSEIVASSQELLDIYIKGVKPNIMISEITCGSVNIENAKVSVPISHYSQIVEKITNLSRSQLIGFLSTRCDKLFLKLYLESNPIILDEVVKAPLDYIRYSNSPRLVAKLYSYGLLDETHRVAFLNNIAEIAINRPDADFLRLSDVRSVLKEEEILIILGEVKSKLIPSIRGKINVLKNEYMQDEAFQDADEHFYMLSESIEIYQQEFEKTDIEIANKLGLSLDKIKRVIKELENSKPEQDDEDYDDDSFKSDVIDRSVFDDIDSTE